MKLIALTGGIASGKSTVSERFRQLGAVVVDADVLAREVVEPGQPALREIAHRFGDPVIGADGRLDRAALGAIVFADPRALADLGAITHPAIWRRARELFDRAEAADPHAVVVYDVPLLAEASADRPLRFDHVVVVDAPVETRIQRMVELRGMSEDEARRRVSAQADDAARLALADDVIDAGGSLDETLRQVDALWQEIAPAA
ncbi:dephospho-CoA kinase [Galbitalea soli]|uniref:Dephospho-CoA kinase n=1 Tax=Galbitalea soli TaxID=1268042 RepID=A0A7C9TN96_9MICO|nr:dephospho-CoA kinase [Galbitalea soli]NEM90177.1 dephospho-CoA kinase [Galbitalea soli]NYJ30885.1 dephospho-CoA kinase [Galbitalea soli]